MGSSLSSGRYFRDLTSNTRSKFGIVQFMIVALNISLIDGLKVVEMPVWKL